MSQNPLSEVLTLQFGEYSNFTASHKWNIREEYFNRLPAHEQEQWRGIAYRFGQDLCGRESYTPRALIFDFRNNFGSLSSTGEFFSHDATSQQPQSQEENPAVFTWAGDLSLHKAPQYSKNAFLMALDEEKEHGTRTQRFEESSHQPDRMDIDPYDRLSNSSNDPYGLNQPGAIKVWSDYLEAPLNRHSLHPLPVAASGNTRSDPFASYFSGLRSHETSALDGEFHDGWEDTIRHFLEESDRLQGTESLVDLKGGYCGLWNEVCEYLKEECRSAPILCFPFMDGNVDPKEVVTLTMALSSLQTHASVICPLSPAQIQLSGGPPSMYCSSAVLAAAIDTITLPFHCPEDNNTLNVSSCMSSWVGMVCPESDKKFVSLATTFPSGDNQQIFGSNLDSAFRSVSPVQPQREPNLVAQGMRHFTVLRGIHPQKQVIVPPHLCVIQSSKYMPIPRSYPSVLGELPLSSTDQEEISSFCSSDHRIETISTDDDGKLQISLGTTIGYSNGHSHTFFALVRNQARRQHFKISLELQRNGMTSEDFEEHLETVIGLCEYYE